MKKCTQCGIEKPLSDFGKRKNSKDGHRANCKACKALSDARWVTNNRERKAAADAALYRKNKSLRNEQGRAYYLRNKDRLNAMQRKWWQENSHTQRDGARARRLENLEQRRADRREHYRANKHMYLANARAREAHISQATPPGTDLALIAKAYEACDMLNQVTGEWHHVDHIVPLRHHLVCGLHVPHNLQILSAEENLRKGNSFRGL